MAVVAWPPPTPPNGRTNTTIDLDNHPSDHNRTADALDTIVAKFPAAGTMPWGRVASATSTATTAGIQSIADLVSVTFTAVAGRRYLVSASYSGIVQSVASAVEAVIRDGANTRLNTTFISAAVGYYFFLHVCHEVAPGAAGSRTYKLSTSVAAGTGTITLLGGADRLHRILVEDVGT